MHPELTPPTRQRSHPGDRLAFTPDDRLVVAGGWPCRLSIIDPDSGEILAEKSRRTLSRFLSVDPAGARLYTGDKTASGYTLPGLKRAPSLKGHRQGINDVAFSPDGDFIATVSGQHVLPADDTLRVWDTGGLEVARIPLPGHGEQVAFLDADHVIVRSAPARVALVQLSTEEVVWSVENCEEHRKVGPFAVSGDRLVVWFSELPGTSDGGFLVLDPHTGATLDRWLLGKMWQSGACYSVACHPATGAIFASVCDRRDAVTDHRVVRMLDPQTGAWLGSFGSRRAQTGRLALSPSGRWLAARIDAQVALWQLG